MCPWQLKIMLNANLMWSIYSCIVLRHPFPVLFLRLFFVSLSLLTVVLHKAAGAFCHLFSYLSQCILTWAKKANSILSYVIQSVGGGR